MSDQITIGIPFYKNGQREIKKAKIGFISNEMISLYGDYEEMFYDLSDLQDDLEAAVNEIAEICVKRSGLSEKRKLAAPIKARIRELRKEVKQGGKNISSARMSLINTILSSNKCHDSDLLNIDWWNKYTTPEEANTFLRMAVLKDMSGAKKKVNTNSTKGS